MPVDVRKGFAFPKVAPENLRLCLTFCLRNSRRSLKFLGKPARKGTAFPHIGRQSRKSIKLRKVSNNYKVYQPADATRLHFIQAAKSLGFSLTEIKEILSEAKHGNSPCPMVREIIERHIEENRRKIKELQKLQKKMESALTDWKQMTNSMPNGDSVCHLIESVAEVKKSA